MVYFVNKYLIFVPTDLYETKKCAWNNRTAYENEGDDTPLPSLSKKIRKHIGRDCNRPQPQPHSVPSTVKGH